MSVMSLSDRAMSGHWGATVANIGGEAPAALVGAYPAKGPVWVSDASHACGLDDLNAGVSQQVPGLPASAQHPGRHTGWRRADTLLGAAGLRRVQVALTPLSEAGGRIAAAAAAELAAVPADIVTDHDRAAGRGYYRDVCFKVNALVNGAVTEIGDGGFTDWTAKLLTNAKERLLISGYGLDRLAALIAGKGIR